MRQRTAAASSLLAALLLATHLCLLVKLKLQTKLPVNFWTVPFLGEVYYALDFKGSQARQLALHKRLGPVFASLLFGRQAVFVGSAEASDLVHYSRHNKDALGVEYIDSIKSILSSEAMALMDAGPKHDEQRQIIMTLIGQKSLPVLFPTIAKEFHSAMQTAAGEATRPAYQDVFAILKDSIWNIMYQVTMGGEADPDVFQEMKLLFVDFGAGLFSLPVQKKYRDAMLASERLFALVQDEFHRRLPTSSPATDLIQAHVNHSAKHGVQPNIKGRVIDIYGSLDTTKSFSTVMFDLLVDRPELLEAIYRSEVAPKFADQGLLHSECSFEAIGELQLVCATVNEVLRFTNITPYIMRVAKRDVDLGNGQTIPKRAFIVSSVFNIIATNPATVDAGEFQPERFLAPRLERERDEAKSGGGKGCFGFGHRTCPGQQLAIAEMRAFLVEMSYFTWERGSQPDYVWNPVPSCPDGFWVRGTRRV